MHLSPGFTNEKKVDHLGLVVELYTKAYDVFKSASVSTTTAVPTGEIAPATGAQGEAAVASDGTGEMQAGTGGLGGRQLLWIAYRIAETYREGGKYGLAVRWVLYFCHFFSPNSEVGSSIVLQKPTAKKGGLIS